MSGQITQAPAPAAQYPAPISEVDESEFQTAGSSTTVGRGVTRPSTGAATRAELTQSRLGARAAKPRIKTLALFSGYKPSGVAINYADNKVGVMPNLSDVLEEIATEAGLDLSDQELMSHFLDAMVTDVYVNPYSDKQPFDGVITVGGGVLTFPRRHIKIVIERHVATNHRRFARAMAPVVRDVMHDNPDFHELLDKRCGELGLSTRAEAVVSFDGADALPVLDRSSASRNAAAKALALSRRQTHRAYGLDNSAAVAGDHTISSTLDHP